MGNEEIRGLIGKKAFEDQLESFCSGLVCVTFCKFSFGALTLFPLSLTHSWKLRVFLEHFGIGSRKGKKKRGRNEEENRKE